MHKYTLFIIISILSLGALSAQDFSDGTWKFNYVTTAEGTDVKVWGSTDTGALIIPKTASNAANSKTYNVTRIRNDFASKSPLLSDGLTANVTSVLIPEGVKFIENQAFYNNFRIVTTFNLPSTMVGISGINIFTWLQSLETIYCAMQTPFIIDVDEQFHSPAGTDITEVTLHVPPGKTAAYQAAGWVGFKAYVEDVTAVKELKSAGIEIGSTVSKTFYLTGLSSDAHVSVFDISGKNVAEFNKVTNNQTLSSASIQKGIYIVKVNENSQVFSTKIAL
jgi:hypothetical protein